MSEDRTYLHALTLLNSRRRRTRPYNADTNPVYPPADFSHMPQQTLDLRGTPSIVGMSDWLSHLGHSQSNLARLNIVHIAGTKGKGSTCAFTRSLLEAHGKRTGWPRPGKIGMYTSPDLIHIRERIQIGGQPLSEAMFARYFFEVWDAVSELERRPRFLQLLCLMAFRAFITEDVDIAIIETHHGGEFDATNVVERPTVTAVSSVGMDHLKQLGPTIENIAWHKAGIFKEGASALTIAQQDEIETVLEKRAQEKGERLEIVTLRTDLPDDAVLRAPAQRINCSLAIAITNKLLHRVQGEALTIGDIAKGLRGFSWAGRFQRIVQGHDQWYLDGAHNELSIKQAVEWFDTILQSSPSIMGIGNHENTLPARVIIFSHISDGRDGVELLLCLRRAVRSSRINPSHIVFTTYRERRDGRTRPDKTLQDPSPSISQLPKTYPDVWIQGNEAGNEQISFEPSIEDALRKARAIGEEHGGMHTLITGSLHLVGGALHLLRNEAT